MTPNQTPAQHFGEAASSPTPDSARSVLVAMRDGIGLATDVYFPPLSVASPPDDDSVDRHPVLLCRTPYDKASPDTGWPAIARYFGALGYGFVAQDVRGKVDSEGEFLPFDQEIDDGFDTIEWIVSQPWSNGRVGMVGNSYYGYTQWAAAASGHPALVAITPRVTSADLGLPTEPFPLQLRLLWALQTWLGKELFPYDDPIDFEHLPAADILPRASGGRRSSGLDQQADGSFAPAPLVVDGHVAALHLGGFFDLLLDGQLATWRSAISAAPAHQFLILDSTDHYWTPRAADGGPAAAESETDRVIRTMAPLVPFLDHFLAHPRPAWEFDCAPVRYQLVNDGWHTAATWPPAAAREYSLVLGADFDNGTRGGSLIERSTAPSRGLHLAKVEWIHDPLHPVPSLEDAYRPLTSPADHREMVHRADVLSFVTEKMTSAMDLAGPLRFEAQVSAASSTTHVMVRLFDIDPGGAHLLIRDGATEISGPWPAHADISLGHTAYRLLPGHCLGVAVSSSSFPKFLRHPGNDTDPWTTTDLTPSAQSIQVGGATPARLVCFVLDPPVSEQP